MDQSVSSATRQTGELGTLMTVSAAHFVSHFHILVLPPLFPFLHTALGVDYVALGVALTIFNVVSGVSQAPMGFVADRIGPRRLLVVGLCLGGLAFGSLAVITSYSWLLVAAATAGLANSVYHPADYAILSSSLSEGRIGKAFSVHTFAGFLGGAVTPATLFTLATTVGLWAAFLAAALLAFAVALALAFSGNDEGRRPASALPVGGPRKSSASEVLNPAIAGLTLFFALIGLSSGSIQNFSVVAFVSGYDMSLSVANVALTAFLTGTAAGVLTGGFLADRTSRHGALAAASFALAALAVLTIAVMSLGAVWIVLLMGAAGFLSGVIAPSRDMLVRAASPPGAEGRAFGIVSTGFNIGGAVGPILFGWIMDIGEPRWIFGASVLFMLVAIVIALLTDRRSPRRAPTAGRQLS